MSLKRDLIQISSTHHSLLDTNAGTRQKRVLKKQKRKFCRNKWKDNNICVEKYYNSCY